MAVQINVAANQAALTASIQAGVQAYNQKFAQNNQVNLSVNQRAFSQPLGRMTGDVKDFEAALAASNARVIAFGASTAVLGGVIRSFKELANVTIDVEKNLADINRVFGLTTSQLQKFSTDLFGVGKQTASSFDDASKAALEFSRQGLKAEEVLLRTKDALTLARVAGISTANSVDALTSTINGFAATGVTTTQILNKLVAVEQDFAVGAGDLAEALSRTGQAAQEAGVSLDQLNALVTSAQQSTARGGAVIGNALKTIFTRLQRTETLDQLEAFNIAVRDVQGNTLPAVTVLQNFAGAYKNLGDAQRAQLSEQVAGVYQVNILKAIVGDLNKSQGVYAGALQRGASATNEAEVATAKLNQTLDALLKQTATSTQQLANNIGKVTFEPLARYGTEQLKSLVESMNEILEGEGVGSTFANGLLKGIRNVIAGPGAIAAFFTLFKLIQNSFTYLAQALPQIAGITTETQNRKNIEQSILQIMQQQGPVSQALAGTMGNQAAQAQLLLQLARQQTAEYQIQSTLAKQLAAQLAGQGVRVKGSGGLQATRAGGYIPNATRMAETVGAQAGGYAPGKVVKSPVGGVMNTAEDVKYVPGFAQPFINPPAGSKAGRAHRQNAISRTGVDPYMNSGFIPNFANTKYFNKNKDTLTLNATEKKPFVIPENQELAAVADINKDSVYGLQYKIKLAGSYSRFSGAFDKKMLDSKQADTILLFSSLQSDQRKTFIENYKKYVSSKEDFQVKPFTANKKETINFSKQLQGVKSDTLGNLYELYLQKKFNLEKNPNQNAISDLDFVDAEAKIGDFSSANLLSKAIRDNAVKKGIKKPYYKDNKKSDKIDLDNRLLTLYTTTASQGFIPNFSPLIDDNARNKHDFPKGIASLPIPDKAIQNILDRQQKRQMTYLDFDRTLVRTTGDSAYGRVAQEQKKGVLQKMFLNKEARLKDVKESRFTQFGELLRQKIQQKIIDPSLLGLMTASDETPGMPEYISSIWGIPKRNQVYSAKPGTKEARLASLGVSSNGFIPNFAPPISMLRIPWFKKYANPSFDAKQPTLNIAGAGVADTFSSTQFRTNKTDYNKKTGDGNVFGPLYEKFVRSSMSLQANKSKIKSLILGQSLEPDTIEGQSSLDAFMELINTDPTDLLDLVGIEIKGGRKDSQSGGSATGIITKKYNDFVKKNPKAAARLRELLGVFNEPGNPQHLQYMSALGKQFLPLAATNYDEIAKNSPELLKVLSQKTNELLTSYVNNPSFYRAEASGGFIPNFNYNDIGLDALTSKLGREGAISQDLTQFVIDLKNQKYAMGDGFHREIIAKNFGEIVTDEELSNPKNANTYLKGSYDKNSGKTIFYKSFAQSMLPGKLFESKHPYIQTVQNELKSRFAKRQASAPVKRTGLAPSERFRRQYPGPSPDNHFNNGLIPNFADPTIKTNSGKDAIESFYRKGSEVEGKKLTGGVIAFPVPQTTDLYSVGSSSVNIPGSGFGVPLYDAVLAEVSKKGAWLTSDRETVSDKARRIWDGYRKLRTGDVKNKKLPIKNWFLDPAFNNGSYEFPMNPQDLLKNKSTWPSENDPVWSLQHAYQFKKSQLDSPVKNKMASGFIPNFADLIDVDTLSKNSIHYSGDLMKLIKDIESSVGRHLTSGELRFLTHPKTNLSKLNDPKILNRFINSERKGGFAGFAKGFLPNFAYKQAVMGLEESMSGEKAVFDNKPFPHIRNKSQPTFSSAISDHGGLSNALSDSMRGQKNAGLMSKGYVPNFAAPQISESKLLSGFPIGSAFNDRLKKALEALNKNLNQLAIDTSLTDKQIKTLERNTLKYAGYIAASGAGAKVLNLTQTSLSEANKNLLTARKEEAKNKSTQRLNQIGTTLAFAGPMAAGLIEQAAYGNQKRTEMTEGNRIGQSVLSTGLTAASTGASIGAAFGPWGAAVGLAVGATIGLAQSLGAASLSADELSQVASEYKSKTQDNVSTAQTYIETLKTLNTSTDPEIIKKASESLAENFANIKDVNLQEIFQKTGTDVKKLGDALNEYEKDRKKTQNEADEDTKAALGSKAKNAKQLSELGYNKTKTTKGPGLVSDSTYLEFSEQNDKKIISDFRQTFDDLSVLTEEKASAFQKLVKNEQLSLVFDTEKVASFLKENGVSEGISDRLASRFDELEEDSNLIGTYLIDGLARLLEDSKKKVKEEDLKKTKSDVLINNFLSLKRELTLLLSDSLIKASDSIKKYEFDSSITNLISGKMKEINDSIYSSISGNLSEMAGISAKSAQLNYTNLFQTSELVKGRQQLTGTTELKRTQNRASYEQQSEQTIFATGEITRNQGTMDLIKQFISEPLNRSRSQFETFAGRLGLSAEKALVLAKSLEANQKSFSDLNVDLDNNLKLKNQEFDLTETANKINYETGLKQLELEKEKLKITYAQKDAILQLRKDTESYKITSGQALELKKIDIGSEFRYLGSGKRETFASQQTDQKSIFDDEQKMAQKQAILDARKSIIEIATQEANINAQNTNTEAILALVDAIAENKMIEGIGVMSPNVLTGKEASQADVDRGGEIYDQAYAIKRKNESLRKSFNERKNTLSYNKLSDLGVTNEMSIEQAMVKLNESKVGKDQSTVNAIDNAIQDLKTASETLGSSATVYAAKVAQAKADFEQSAGFVNNMAIGFKSLGKEADDMVDQLGRNLPGMFADGLVDGIKAAIRESDNLGTALMGIASKFLDEISTTLMKAGVRNILSGVGFGDLIGGMTGNQKGGYIRAQSGMYISGTGTGDKYPAMLENGEYVLNRNAVMAMGGPSALDSLNFSAAPRFASGGSFGFDLASSKSDQDNLANMEKYMTSEGLDNSQLYNELSDVAKQKAAEDRAKKLEAKKQKAAMIGSLVAAVATIAIGAGLSNMASNAKATKAEALAVKAQGPENLTKSEIKAYEGFQKSGMINSYGEYAGPQAQTGFRSLTSKPFYSSNIYGPNPYAPAFKKNGRQTGGLIGSRLSDTIPGYMEGGLYNSPMVKRYGTGMQSGGSSISGAGNSNSTVNNNTNANNSFNFNTSVQRDGSIKMGANTTSYQQQDVELSKNLNTRMYAVVTEVIRKEKQFGGSLAGIRN